MSFYGDVLHLAAECHRRKWRYSDDNPEAFDALHQMGWELRRVLDKYEAERYTLTLAEDKPVVLGRSKQDTD